MAATSKLEMILELKGKFDTALTKVRNRTNRNVSAIQEKIQSLKSSATRAFMDMRKGIPGFSKALEVIGNPFVMAAAAATSFIAAASKVVSSAANFSKEFLNIKQLNLDKSKNQLQEYRQLAFDVAFDVGMNADATAKAFYDVQSGLGTFGQDTADIVRQVGRFSIATGQQLPDGINATVKSMKAFKLSASDVDMLLQSNAKTVQLGITTFSELAQVQSEYAGAASSAGQGVDTANKLFAVFTAISSNSATAATKAKTAFESLTAKKTMEGFKGIEVSLFDANKKMRSLEDITKDLVPEIAKMSDQKFLNFREGIGGTEGLRDLLNQLRNDGAGVLQTFQKFDTIKFDMGKALRNANGDFATLKGIANERFSTMMKELGVKILPYLARGYDAVNNSMVWFRENTALVKSVLIDAGLIFLTFKAQAIASLTAASYGMVVTAIKSFSLAGALGFVRLAITAVGSAIYSIPIVGWIAAAVTGFILLYKHSDGFRAVIDGIVNVMHSLLPLLQAAGQMFSGMANGNLGEMKAGVQMMKTAWGEMDVSKSFNHGYDKSMLKSRIASSAMEMKKEALSARGLTSSNVTNTPVSTTTTTDTADSNATSLTSSPTGETKPNVKHVSVNIESLHKGSTYNLYNDSGKANMTLSEFEEHMEGVFLRMIRQFEYS